MSLHFRYKRLKTRQSVWPLGGRWVRPRPIILVALVGPTGTFPHHGVLDTAADDTVFPEKAAALIGLDLTNAPAGEAAGVGGTVIPVRYAQVNLRITDGREFREWIAWVGFTPVVLNQALLGFAGFLQFFSATFLGDREEVELSVNSLYTGT